MSREAESAALTTRVCDLTLIALLLLVVSLPSPHHRRRHCAVAAVAFPAAAAAAAAAASAVVAAAAVRTAPAASPSPPHSRWPTPASTPRREPATGNQGLGFHGKQGSRCLVEGGPALASACRWRSAPLPARAPPDCGNAG